MTNNTMTITNRPKGRFRQTFAAGKRGAFSLTELVVVMALVALLLVMALPAITRSRETARRMQCRNNLRNIALAFTEFDGCNRRLPASGNHYDRDGVQALHHSWAVSILPWVDQSNLYNQWRLDKPITHPLNRSLVRSHVPVYICPVDLSRSRTGGGDLSYAVNGGVGFTVRLPATKVGDCPVDRTWSPIDLNGDGVSCLENSQSDSAPSDRSYFKRMGLFFLENWECEGTVRYHSLADIEDGLSQTFMAAENVRVGYDPMNPAAGFASPIPTLCAFYIGNPCKGGHCSRGNVDYSASNDGFNRINSGRRRPEGKSPVPNSFHTGGVHMAFADGHVTFLAEMIDGSVYAALASPQGVAIDGTSLQQNVIGLGSN